uniref:Cytochrome b5 heme-binding domain-containing protein n=1 Tax=Strigamia maritima TaxID=126957 RepID=T1IHL6_STRMM
MMAEKALGVVTLIAKFALDIVSSPLNLALVVVCGVLLYKILYLKRESIPKKPREPDLPKLKKHDFTLDQMREFDGRSASGRILVAVNGKVFDVTRGKKFYGQGGPYAAFAGRDASRGLATFSVEAIQDDYDDLSDLNTMQMDSVREWEMQFKEKYDYVGRLLKPGEESNDYSDDDDCSQNGTKADDETRKENEENKSEKLND